MNAKTYLKTTCVVALLTLAAGCSKKSADIADSALLEYVPADTPYFMGKLQAFPDDLSDKFEPRLDTVLKAYQTMIRAAIRDGLENAEPVDDEAAVKRERGLAVADKLVELLSIDGLRSAGIGRDSTFALYGAGLLPVIRADLTDAAAFTATLAEIEKESGSAMSSATLDGQDYRYFGDDDVRFIVAQSEGQVVITLVPAMLGDDSLRSVLGITKPAASLASSGRLQAVAKEYGFTSHVVGVVDIEKIALTFLQDADGINAELLALAEFDSEPLSAVCKSELSALAGIAPRLVTGYTEMNAKRIVSNTVVELRADIADGLATIAAPVPGLGNKHGGLLSMGMSIDMLAARAFYEARLDAIEADPYECELLADLQAGVGQGRAILEQPIPPIAYGLKGFLAVIDNIEGMDMANQQPPTAIDMRFLLATDNAPGLLAMGSMFSPELAALNLQPDGKPVQFESAMMQGPVDEVWVAMNETGLALSVGNGGKDKLGAMLGAKAGTPPPFFSMDMDAERYYSFIADASAMQADTDEDTSPEVAQAISDIMGGFGDLFERISVSVNFTDRGIELPSEVTLAE
jgi:hypothetical protein